MRVRFITERVEHTENNSPCIHNMGRCTGDTEILKWSRSEDGTAGARAVGIWCPVKRNMHIDMIRGSASEVGQDTAPANHPHVTAVTHAIFKEARKRGALTITGEVYHPAVERFLQHLGGVITSENPQNGKPRYMLLVKR